jgi:diguanylate cyclase (GGDEF)-like protein
MPQQTPDPQQPFELAPGVWWVGCHQADDSFQAHAYLVVNGSNSVLIDPGGRRTFPETLRKIRQIIPFESIRYFVCQHQDPDITASLIEIDAMAKHPDAVIVTHWRAQMLMKEYGLALPFLCVEKNDWKLDLGGRMLKFVFTPYAHFPGAFCTFDETSRVLFSSDLFGGFTEGFKLFAEDESYFEAMRPFHEHYIASNEVLVHAVGKIRQLPLTMICPQHGRIIPAKLTDYMYDRLISLDCGLFLLAQGSADIHRLTLLSKTLRDFTNAMVLYRDFREIIDTAIPLMSRLLPVESLAFLTQSDEGEMMALTPENRYRAQPANLPKDARNALLSKPLPIGGTELLSLSMVEGEEPKPALAFPLNSGMIGRAGSIVVLTLSQAIEVNEQTQTLLQRLSQPLQIAIEREMMLRSLEIQREQIYQRSIRDPLTGLFNRSYMHDMVTRLMSIQDRDPTANLAVAVMDVDHFKSVNDHFGHNQGDLVLKDVAKCVQDIIRDGDLPVRLGGEEFAIFVSGAGAERVEGLAERLRAAVERLDFSDSMKGRSITASLGTAVRIKNESLIQFIARADKALYQAKSAGRNRVVSSTPIE